MVGSTAGGEHGDVVGSVDVAAGHGRGDVLAARVEGEQLPVATAEGVADGLEGVSLGLQDFDTFA